MRSFHCSMLHLCIIAQNSFGRNGETEFSGGIHRIPFSLFVYRSMFLFAVLLPSKSSQTILLGMICGAPDNRYWTEDLILWKSLYARGEQDVPSLGSLWANVALGMQTGNDEHLRVSGMNSEYCPGRGSRKRQLASGFWLCSLPCKSW